MKGFDEFIKIFGNVTVLQVAELILAFVFMVLVYKKIKKFFNTKIIEENKRAEVEKVRDEQIHEALEGVRKYPEYRQQSITIQHQLQEQIENINNRLSEIEESTKRRERNKIRDRLLQNYRYYTNPETNPSHSWSHMEAEAFWELFKEYEAADGNGYMHSEVLPAMQRLNVIDVGEK